MTADAGALQEVVRTPIRVVVWTNTEQKQVTAVYTPVSDDDPTPWAAYVGDVFFRRVPDDSIPSFATTVYGEPGTSPETEIVAEDGKYYDVVVDNRPGVGVRNSPLCRSVPDKPWAVSLFDQARRRITIDALPDSAVVIVAPSEQ